MNDIWSKATRKHTNLVVSNEHKDSNITQLSIYGYDDVSLNLNAELFQKKLKNITTLKCRQFRLINFNNVNINIKYIQFSSLSIQRIEIHYFEDLHELTYLNIRHNNISIINNDTFKDLHKLNELFLVYNNIIYIESRAFVGLYKLVMLYLNGNSLLVLDIHLFRITNMLGFDLTKTIRDIKLRNSELKIIKSRSFIFDNMTSINLSDNKITSLENNAFEINIIEIINLQRNKLSTISRQVFFTINIIEILNLSDNELECDCGLYWIKNNTKMLNHLKKIVNKDMTCGQNMLLKHIEYLNCYFLRGTLYIYIYIYA